jgi:general secretion pathway protein G
MSPKTKKAVSVAAAGAAMVLLLTLAIGVNVECDLFGSLTGHSARVDRAKIDVQRIASDGVEAFKARRGRYPTVEEGIGILLREKFLRSNTPDGTLADPWGREYIYRHPGQTHADSFDVLTYGADGQPGGRAEDADIVND